MIAPGDEKGSAQSGFSGFCEEDASAAFAAPSTVDGLESGGMGLHKIFLLDGCEFDHAKLFAGIGEGGKDPSGDAEIGVVHVHALFSFGEAESYAAEVGWSRRHDALLVKV